MLLRVIAALLVAAIGLGAAPSPASAVNIRDPFGAMIWSGGDGFVYVEAGETLRLMGASRLTTYRVTDPHGVDQVLTRPDGTPVGTTCVYNGGTAPTCNLTVVATTTGVWRVRSGGGAPLSNTSIYSSIVEVTAADGTPRPGRLWMDNTLGGAQHASNQTDVSMWLLAPTGVQHAVTLRGLAGFGSTFQFNNKGVVHAGTCDSTYFSVPINGGQQPEPAGGLNAADYSTDVAACPDLVRYRIFPEPPDPAMPAEVALWADGRTSDRWVYRDYAAPALTSPELERTGSLSHAGTITSTLSGQPGRVGAAIDIDGNGSTSDPIDRIIEPTPFGLGPIAIPWDGLDGLGNPVSPLVGVRIEVVYEGEAEVHLTMTDVEGLSNGLSLVRLNGPGAPDSTVSWDDSQLLLRATDPPVPSPTGDNVVSTPVGAHRWFRGTSGVTGWGDSRHIDHWSTLDTTTSATADIGPLEQAVEVAKTADTPVVGPGDVITYTVAVTNTGTADITATDPIELIDVLSPTDSLAEVEVVSVSSGTTSGGVDGLTWTIDDLVVGDTATLVYRATAATTGTGPITNTARVDAPGPSCAPPLCAQVTVEVISDPGVPLFHLGALAGVGLVAAVWTDRRRRR